MRALEGPETRMVNLEGATVLPGFYDGHIHISVGKGPGVQAWNTLKTREELFKAIRQHADTLKDKDEWVYGYVGDVELPDRTMLDNLVSDHPVVLTQTAHIMAVNSLALKKAGIADGAPDRPGGNFVKDQNGRLTGRIEEVAAWRKILNFVPSSEPTDEQAILATIRAQLGIFPPLGITTANVAGVRLFDPNDPYRYRSLTRIGWVQRLYERDGHVLPRLRTQIRLLPGYEKYDDPVNVGAPEVIKELEGCGYHTGFGNDRLKLGAVKMSIDGRGSLRIPPEVFYKVARRAHQLGWQLGIHAGRTPGIKVVVEAIEKILAEHPRADHRHYLHHATLPNEDLIKKMASLKMAVCTEPKSIHGSNSDAQPLRNPHRSYTDAGIPIGYASDLNAVDVLGRDAHVWSPLFGIWSAVTRQGEDGKVRNPAQKVSLQEAIRFYTLGAAYITFDEKTLGTLEVGKAADMVVLSDDIFNVKPDQIKDLKIKKTIVAAEAIYSA